MLEMGHGGGSEPSVGGGADSIDKVENDAISWVIEPVEGPSRE